MATVATTGNGSAPAISNNDGGTIVKAGDIDTVNGPIQNKFDIFELATDLGLPHGSKVLEKSGTGASTTDRAGITKPLAGNTVSYLAGPTEWIMRGGNVTQTIAGSGNTVLAGGGNDYDGEGAIRDNIHSILNTRAHGSGETTAYNMYARPSTEITPNFTKGGDAGSLITFVAPSGDGNAPASDDAAFPTRAVPGELTYHFGELAEPTTDEYKASDTFES